MSDIIEFTWDGQRYPFTIKRDFYNDTWEWKSNSVDYYEKIPYHVVRDIKESSEYNFILREHKLRKYCE